MMKLALCVAVAASILEVSGAYFPDESPYGFRFANTRLDLLDLLGLERFVFTKIPELIRGRSKSSDVKRSE